MVTAAAALETKSTTPKEFIDSRGGVYWTIAPKNAGHGKVVDMAG